MLETVNKTEKLEQFILLFMLRCKRQGLFSQSPTKAKNCALMTTKH